MSLGYIVKICLIYIFLVADLVISGISDFTSSSDLFMMYGFLGAQLAFIMLNILVLFLLFFGTYLFQVGLVSEVAKSFKVTFASIFLYIIVFVIYAAVKISLATGDSQDFLWSKPGFVCMSILQKLFAIGYYLALVSATIQLGEAKWYRKSHWVKEIVGTLGMVKSQL
jgi:hypothetical protein